MKGSNIIQVTTISKKDEDLLVSAGFLKQGKNEWIVPSDLTIITKHPRYDLIDIDIFYGDTKIVHVWGKTAFYDYHLSISIDKENLQKYIEKSISSNRGENVANSIKEAQEASIKESERQKNLAKTNPSAYEAEGMAAVMSLLANNLS